MAVQDGRLHIDYENVTFLGSGAFGKVFRARHLLDGQEYAIKKVLVTNGDPDSAVNEVRTLAQLKHDNVVGYYTSWLANRPSRPNNSVGSEDRSSDPGFGNSINSLGEEGEESGASDVPSGFFLYIAMELCSGITLENWLYDNKTPESRALNSVKHWMRQLLDGLDYIHENNLIHRDLKPANILLHWDPKTIKIGDFGLVTRNYDFEGEELVEMMHTRRTGTPLYMAPEQWNTGSYGHMADVFSMGLIFIELLYPFGTNMEKYVVFNDRRQNRIPNILMNGRIETEELIMMTDPDPENRMFFLMPEFLN